MKLALSSRIIVRKDGTFQMDLEDFIKMASEIGYEGVELRGLKERPPQVSPDAPREENERVKKLLDKYGVECVWVRGVPPHDENSFEKFKGWVDVALITRTRFVGTHYKKRDILWMQKAADYARDKGVMLTAQIHSNTPFSTVASALKTLRMIDRDNFGLTFDPSHLMKANDDYGVEAIKKLRKHIFIVAVQNIRKVDEGKFEHCLIGDSGGIKFASVIRGLKEIDFEGYITVLQPKNDALMDSVEMARLYYKELSKLIS